MKINFAALFVLGVVAPMAIVAQNASTSPVVVSGSAPASTASLADKTPAEQRIEAAKRQIAADSKKTQAYNELAEAFLRRARETANTRYHRDAEAALVQGLKLEPGDFQLEKMQVELMLVRGEFAAAKEKATQLNKRYLDDVMVYGYLAEAEIGLGDYASAETNAQWMLNMLPNNVPGLLIGAKLRAHYGDANGAIEFLNLAYTETSPIEAEELAWIANQIASIDIDAGKIDAAATMLEQAESTFPHYPYTAQNLARISEVLAGSAVPARSAEQSATSNAGSAESNLTSHSSEPAQHQIDPSNASAPPEKKDAEPAFEPVPAELLTPRPSETDRLIKKAQAVAAADPTNAKNFAVLGAEYFQRARETGDVSDYEQAEKALTKSLDLGSTDFSSAAALGTLAEVCMGEHRFTDALQYAQRALALGSGDLSPFAIIGDAYADMGEYNKARDAYERLASQGITADSRTAYARDSRLAYLSFVRGDTAAAIRGMKLAVAEGTEAAIPSENLAWLYYELGEFTTQAGDADAADAAYRSALKIHPGDYRALAGLARLRANHGDDEEAIRLYEKAIAVVPMPIFVAELGDLYLKVGKPEEAKKEYALVEYIGLLGHVNQVLHNRDLALFYADHDLKPGEALDLARKEFEVRHDIYTWDSLAWALYKNGKIEEAAKASDEALRYGTRDAMLLFHAGMIAERLGDKDRARKHLAAALEINPRFHSLYAGEAQHELTAINASTATQESAVSHAR
jgi:tetratricopeptide (TPR) repeat protein